MESSPSKSFLSYSELCALIEYCESTLVPSCKEGFDKQLASSDFSSYSYYCSDHLLAICNILDLNREGSPIEDVNYYNKVKSKWILYVVVLSGQHSSVNLWSNELSVQLAGRILSKTLIFFDSTSLSQILCVDNQNLLKKILSFLRPFLLRETWKNNPAMVQCYSWLLKHVKNPHLGENLSIILPTALIITDDFDVKNIICGLECLDHIIKFCDKAQLSYYGQDQVLLKTFESLFHFSDTKLISPLVSVFVQLLEKKHPPNPLFINLELDFSVRTSLLSGASLEDGQPQRHDFDPAIEVLLSKMLFEQKLEAREAYISGLPNLILARRLGILHHSALVMNVIEEYVLEPTSALQGLEALDAYIKVCWPRVGRQRNRFLALILKAFYTVCHRLDSYDTTRAEQFKEKGREIVSTLEMACPYLFEPELNQQTQVPSVNGLLSKLGLIEFIHQDMEIIKK